MGSGAHYQCNGKVLRNIVRSNAQAADYLINGGMQFVYAFAGTTEEGIMRAHSPLPTAAALSSGARVRERKVEHGLSRMRRRPAAPSGTLSSLLHFVRDLLHSDFPGLLVRIFRSPRPSRENWRHPSNS